MFGKECVFQCDVIVCDYWEVVQGQDVVGFDFVCCDWVVCVIGVDVGLESGSGVYQFVFGSGFCDFVYYGGGGMQCDFVFWNVYGGGFDVGCVVDVGDVGYFGDMGDFFGGFYYVQLYGWGGDINEFDFGEFCFQGCQSVEIDMVEFDVDLSGVVDDLVNGVKVVVFLLVGIGQVFVVKGVLSGLVIVDVGVD